MFNVKQSAVGSRENGPHQFAAAAAAALSQTLFSDVKALLAVDRLYDMPHASSSSYFVAVLSKKIKAVDVWHGACAVFCLEEKKKIRFVFVRRKS